jgi:hypothetical protein
LPVKRKYLAEFVIISICRVRVEVDCTGRCRDPGKAFRIACGRVSLWKEFILI